MSLNAFIERIRKRLLWKISMKFNCTSETYSRNMSSMLLNRAKCSFYVKYVELLYDIQDTEVLKAFYQREKSKKQHEQLKLIYSYLYDSKPNYCLIDDNGVISQNMSQKQRLIDKIEDEKHNVIKYNANDYYQPILPTLISQEIAPMNPNRILNTEKANKSLSTAKAHQTKGKEEDSIDEVKSFISSVSAIEENALAQSKDNQGSHSHYLWHNDSKRERNRKGNVKIDMTSMRSSIEALESLRKKKKTKTTKQSKLLISLNKDRPSFNPMFPSTRSFFFQKSRQENKINALRSSLHDALKECSHSKMRNEFKRQKHSIQVHPTANLTMKSRIFNYQVNGNRKMNHLNGHNFTQNSLAKSNIEDDAYSSGRMKGLGLKSKVAYCITSFNNTANSQYHHYCCAAKSNRLYLETEQKSKESFNNNSKQSFQRFRGKTGLMISLITID